MMRLLVISASLNPSSRSAILAKKAYDIILEQHYPIDFIDLRQCNLPFCDGASTRSNPEVKLIAELIERSHGILLASPIYNYTVSSATKNLIELTGPAWKRKVISLLAVAGSPRSYMSLMPFANSLMLDYNCSIVPDFILAHESDFSNNDISNPETLQRLQHLTQSFIAQTNALKDLQIP